MKRLPIIAFLLLTSFHVFSQRDVFNNKEKGTYVKLKFFKKIFNKNPTKKDSANFKITDGDTLVFVKNFEEFMKKASRNKEVSFHQESRSYIPLNQYKKTYSKIITKEDTLNFQFKDKDTLVLVSNKEFYKKRISVVYEPKDSTFLEVYKDIVYLKYRDSANSNKQNMHLWQGDIKIFITKNVHHKVKKELKKFAKYLSGEVDSLNIKFVNKIEKSNYIIYGINSDIDHNYEPRIRNKIIDYYVTWNRKQFIYDGKLQIDSRAFNNIDDLVLKSKKTFLSSLGRFYWTHKLPKENYFSLNYSDEKKFTKTDLEILKYHYSYGICKGTELKTFEENHKRAKEITSKGGKMMFTHIY